MGNVERDKFDLAKYLAKSKRIATARSFEFKNKDIGNLPFITDKPIDLKDTVSWSTEFGHHS